MVAVLINFKREFVLGEQESFDETRLCEVTV